MILRKLRLDVAFRDNAGVIDVVEAIERAVKKSSDDVLAAEVVFEYGDADVPTKRKKRRHASEAT